MARGQVVVVDVEEGPEPGVDLVPRYADPDAPSARRRRAAQAAAAEAAARRARRWRQVRRWFAWG
jgi:hypothetical protein